MECCSENEREKLLKPQYNISSIPSQPNCILSLGIHLSKNSGGHSTYVWQTIYTKVHKNIGTKMGFHPFVFQAGKSLCDKDNSNSNNYLKIVVIEFTDCIYLHQQGSGKAAHSYLQGHTTWNFNLLTSRSDKHVTSTSLIISIHCPADRWWKYTNVSVKGSYLQLI